MGIRFKNITRVILIFIIFIIFNLNIVEASSNSYTVDDLRDIIGGQRVDSNYTESEISDIISKYNEIEQKNLYAKMFELGKEIDIDKDIEEEMRVIESKVESLSAELEKLYKSGNSIKEVLRVKTELDTQIYKIENLREIGYYIEVDYTENKWSEEYEKVQGIISTMSQDFEIGDIGSGLRSPVYSGFRITSPYGFRIDPITKDELTFHRGLDLGAPLDDYIFSLWNGVVSNTYESESGGKTIEIAHGPYLTTRYLHLNKIDVGIGQKVSQYDIIGGAGSTGLRSTGVHLHLEIILDGENINPLYVFGTPGLKAFKSYISYHPERNRELFTIEKEIKGKPSKEEVIEEIRLSKYSRPILLQEGDIITYLRDGEKEINPFTYDIPLGLSKDEKELVDYINNVLMKKVNSLDVEEVVIDSNSLLEDGLLEKGVLERGVINKKVVEKAVEKVEKEIKENIIEEVNSDSTLEKEEKAETGENND